jgi:hypothetical protein
MMNLVDDIYWAYPGVIEFLLYFLFFGAAARLAFAKHYGESGKKLAIPIGLVLAGALIGAQEQLGFSLSSLGPAALTIIALSLAAAVYGAAGYFDLPIGLRLLVSGLFGVVLARTLAPGLTERILVRHPNAILIAIITLAVLLWNMTTSEISKEQGGAVSRPLVHFGVLPRPKTVEAVAKRVRRDSRSNTRKNRHEEQKSERGLRRAEKTLYTKGMTPAARNDITKQIKTVENELVAMTRAQARLHRLDKAIQDADTAWLQRAAKLNASQLTTAQRKLLRENVRDERNRIGIEKRIRNAGAAVDAQVVSNREKLGKSLECLQSRNGPGAAAWLEQAQDALREVAKSQRRIASLEKALLRLYERQEKSLLK